MTYKPKWACANCGMFSSRKWSVQRHITSLHSGQGVLLSYIDYVVGRQKGYYYPNAVPNFVTKPKPELVLSPPKTCDVIQEEFWRESARQAVRKANKPSINY
ncbi:MAG: hypothetical protein WBF33_12900 [Candidatus Nitrosopolaris sp.]